MARSLEEVTDPAKVALWKALSRKLSWAVTDTLPLSTENRTKVKMWSRGLASQLLNHYAADIESLAPPPDNRGAGGGARGERGSPPSSLVSPVNRKLDTSPELLERARQGLKVGGG